MEKPQLVPTPLAVKRIQDEKREIERLEDELLGQQINNLEKKVAGLNYPKPKHNLKPFTAKLLDENRVDHQVPVKKPFVRPEHLTEKPLRNHEGLAALKSELEKVPSPDKGHYRNNKRR